MPKVSVIIPNYNHEKFLRKRLDSIVNQTFQDFEIIILDDCSTDGSRKIIEEYQSHPKVSKILYNTENSGSTFKQWEKGMLLASGEWVWIAESDDYATTDFLQTLTALTSQYPNIGIALSNSYKVDNDEEIELYEYMTTPFKSGVQEVRERLCHYNTITNASACLFNRTIALKSINGLSEFKSCGDWIFYTRILQHSDLAYSPKKLNYYRWHVNNVSFSASKSGSYITEGVKVINDIDFKIVHFSTMQFLSLSKGWINKVRQVKFRDRLTPSAIILNATMRF